MRALSLYPHSPDDVIERIAQRPEAMPTKADVVIVGGGIVGVASAYFLSLTGMKVVLVEKDRVASQQSGRNWGFVRTQYRDPAELPLAVDALSLWPSLDKRLEFATGWRASGCIFVAKDDAEYEGFASWRSSVAEIATDAQMISAAGVAHLMPGFDARVSGALYTASDGQAEPGLATTAFAKAAEAVGAQILEDCGASEIEMAGGRVVGVATEHGVIQAGAVVCAAGATSHRFLKPLSLFLPQQVVRNTVSLTIPAPMRSQPCFCGLGLGLRQRADGSYILAAESTSDIDLTFDLLREASFFLPEFFRNRRAFALSLGRPLLDDLHSRLVAPENRTIEPRRPWIPPNARRAEQVQTLFRTLFDGVGEISVVKSWAGNIDVLPDALPVIDAPVETPGLIVATGFSGHGFGLGPAVGKRVAELARGAESTVPLEAFRLDRFRRGAFGPPHAPL